jgi:hypothetical protein
MKAMRAALGVATLVSAYTAGVLGAVAMIAVGPWLAMGARMWLGDTEPAHPHLAYPFLALFVGLMLPVAPMYRKRWDLAGIAAFPVALLPFWQLWRLWVAAAPT